MSWGKLLAKVLIIAAAVLWTRMAMTMESRGQLPSKARAGQLAVAVMGWMFAWGAWRRVDGEGSGGTSSVRRRQDAAERPMFAGPVGNAPPLDGPRLDLGACPACGSTQSLAASRGPDGRLRVRCRDCGLVGNPPDEGALARRSSRPTDHRSMAAPDCVRTVPHTSHPNIGMGKALLTAVAASVALVGWGGMILAAYFLAQLGKGWGGAS